MNEEEYIMKKSYCKKCRKEVGAKTKVCSCGHRTFIYGENFSLDEKGPICVCGNKFFRLGIHMNYTDKSVYNYSCTECDNVIGIEYNRTEEESSLWENL